MTDFNEATASVIIIAERLLSAEKDKTAALISARVDMAAGIVAVSAAEPIDKSAAVAELIRRYSQWIGKDTTLSDDTGHKAWLSAAKKKDWRYWARYRDLLATKSMRRQTGSSACWRILHGLIRGIAAAWWWATSSQEKRRTTPG
jgi:hypothetical protein